MMSLNQNFEICEKISYFRSHNQLGWKYGPAPGPNNVFKELPSESLFSSTSSFVLLKDLPVNTEKITCLKKKNSSSPFTLESLGPSPDPTRWNQICCWRQRQIGRLNVLIYFLECLLLGKNKNNFNLTF